MFELDGDNDRIFQEIWKSSLVGLAVVSDSGHFLRSNPAFHQIVEYNELELRQKRFHDITHPDDLAIDVQNAEETAHLLRSGYDMRKRYITKTGKIVHVLLRVRPIVGDDGSFRYFISQIVETTPFAMPGIAHRDEIYEHASFWRLLIYRARKNWPMVTTIAGAIAVIIAKVIEELKR